MWSCPVLSVRYALSFAFRFWLLSAIRAWCYSQNLWILRWKFGAWPGASGELGRNKLLILKRRRHIFRELSTYYNALGPMQIFSKFFFILAVWHALVISIQKVFLLCNASCTNACACDEYKYRKQTTFVVFRVLGGILSSCDEMFILECSSSSVD